MKKKQQPNIVTQSSVMYYVGRILQRAMLCITVTLTGIYWAILVSNLVLGLYISRLPNTEIKESFGQNQIVGILANGLKLGAIKWAICTAALSLLLLTVIRFRKYEKPLVVDGVVVAIFCLLSAIFAREFVMAMYSPF